MPTETRSTLGTLPNYASACQYVEGFIDYEKKRELRYNPRTFNLVRMSRLLSLIGDPHRHLRVIHVAGSKGKGSTAAMIASILSASGYRTGLYTSPHLISSRERFRVGDQLISEEAFVAQLNRLWPHLERMREEGTPPTFFEIYTALGFLYFAQQAVDWLVLEVGLGGRLDATNVVESPAVSVITPISLEHTQLLGSTLPAIAREKAGIIKSGCPVVIAPQLPAVQEVLESICQERHAPWVSVAQDVQIGEGRTERDGQRFSLVTPERTYPALWMPLLGAHQRLNAAVAVRTVERLAGTSVSADAIRRGLAQVRWPGRMQRIPGDPPLLVDGAHSPASIRALCRAIAEHFSYDRLIFVVGLSADKAIHTIGKELDPFADKLVVTRASDMPRALDPSRLAQLWSSLRTPLQVASCVEEALARALGGADQRALICVTGSLYLVGEVLERLGYQSDELVSGDSGSSPSDWTSLLRNAGGARLARG